MITLAEAKAHLRVDHDHDDAYITSLISTAVTTAEQQTWRTYTLREREVTFDRWPSLQFEIPYPPLVSIEAIEYTTADGIMHTIAPDRYIVDTKSSPGRVQMLEAWPSANLRKMSAITARYRAGYQDLPKDLHHALLLRIAHYYENREAVLTVGHIARELPMAVKSLETPYRVFGWSR